MQLLFSHLNLRHNPFGELDKQQRGAVAVVDCPDIEPGQVWQYIGDAGRGKSTHLLALLHHFPTAQFEYIPRGQHHFVTDPTRCDFLLLDEAQRLSWPQRRRLFAHFPRLVLGTHRDLSDWTQRPTHTRYLRGLDVDKLAKVAAARIQLARRGPGPLPQIPRRELQRLIDFFGDDLRSIEAALYETFQQLKEPGDVKVQAKYLARQQSRLSPWRGLAWSA